MGEIDYDLATSSNKLNQAVEKVVEEGKTEFSDKTHRELLSSCIDVFYCISEGELWGRTFMHNSKQQPNTDFPNGTDLNLLPIGFSSEERSKGGGNMAVFTFTESAGSPVISAVLTAECKFTKSGHEVQTIRSAGMNGQTESQLIGRIASMARGLTEDLTLPTQTEVSE